MQNFVATINLDETAFNVFVKALNQLPTGEAGDLCFAFKQTFFAQKQRFEEELKKQAEDQK